MDFKTFSEDELNTFSKDIIITLYLQLSSSFQLISEQNSQIIEQNKKLLEQSELQISQINAQITQIDNLQEQIAILNNYRFGRHTEKTSEIFDGQYCFAADGSIILNEAEYLCDTNPEPDKTDEEMLKDYKALLEARKRKKGVRKLDLSMAEVERKDYDIPKEVLEEMFPEGYRELKEFVTSTVEYIPGKAIVHEEHVHKYKSKKTDKFVIAEHPTHLLAHSMITPSLFARAYTDKYVNGMPINRVAKEFGWMDTIFRRQTMSRWMIRVTGKYLMPVLERMEAKMKSTAKLIHCDETPFVCVEDHRKPGKTKNSKSYMWVFHTADQHGSPPIFIYKYKENRRTENEEEYLKDYKGYIMADGYEPYHTVARKSDGDIVVAGCWAHCKRKFADVVKADTEKALGTVAFEGNNKIAKLYRVDNRRKNASPEERLAYRKEKVAPLVDEIFEWAKEHVDKTVTKATNEALHYLINQEQYLRTFLTDGMIPLDNSDAERSIRSFCIGKHAWHISATSSGAEKSGMLYSIAETSKANGLKPFDYMKYLLEQLLLHENEITDELVDSLLPWSETLPEELRVKVKPAT